MRERRRAIYVNCDGLGVSWISDERTPSLARLHATGVVACDHRAVFPSVTRCSAASLTTGCLPRRHGLHGNRMGLQEDGRLVVRDVGLPDFRDHMRRATGGTLKVPSLAERVADRGSFIAFSNVSPGAAYFLDPEHHGFVYHRAGSFGPGGRAITGPDHLDVSHDLAGDVAMTERFCAEIISERQPAVAILWLANPDLTLHSSPLGSPAHLDAMRVADRCVAQVMQAVAAQRAAGDDILVMVGSDHGQETIHAGVDITDWLARAGLAHDIASGALAVATQGTAALIYTSPKVAGRMVELVPELEQQTWVGQVILGEALSTVGHEPGGGLIAAVDMAQIDRPNAFSVPFGRYVAVDGDKPPALGCGQHGGLGPDETRPFLVIDRPGVPPGTITERTSLVDIAPSILAFLGVAADGLDGRPLLEPGLRAKRRTAIHPSRA
jgi:arylsulfatase A-like enzyme